MSGDGLCFLTGSEGPGDHLPRPAGLAGRLSLSELHHDRLHDWQKLTD